MLNLDKGWDYREQLLPVLVATGTVDHGIFKGSPTVAAAEEFMARDSRIQYMHIVDDATAGEAFAFKGRQPVAVEVVFDSAADPQAQPEYLKQLASQSRVWINSMWNSVAAGNTDEASLRTDPLLGWNNLVTNYRATVIQTDNVETLDYWRDGGPLKLWDRQPGANTVRVQAEDFSAAPKTTAKPTRTSAWSGPCVPRRTLTPATSTAPISSSTSATANG
jgi:glycerophosphoryl diester phosphodiesterase